MMVYSEESRLRHIEAAARALLADIPEVVWGDDGAHCPVCKEYASRVDGRLVLLHALNCTRQALALLLEGQPKP